MNTDGQVGNRYQRIQQVRPYDFGTDAIERQRVSLGQSLIDADFEYGLQATKWQTHTESRKFLSFNEIPGTDIPFSNIFAGSDNRTINIVVPPIYYANLQSGNSNFNYPLPGQYISVQGLQNYGSNAQGIFQVLGTSNIVGPQSNTVPQIITYYSRGNVYASSFTNYHLPTTSVRRCIVMNSGVSNVSGTSSQFYSPVNQIGLQNIQLNYVGTAVSNVLLSTTSPNHGILPGMSLYVANTFGYNQSSNTMFLTSNIGGQHFVVTQTPSSNTMVLSNATIANPAIVGFLQSTALPVSSILTPNVYVASTGYATHRPYDGGVLITNNNPAFGMSFIRQTKKVFRYQSGKGLLWSSGTLFSPNNDISSISSSATTVGSTITITCSVPHGSPQVGATCLIRGVTTSGYNGTYSVSRILDSFSFQVLATQTLGSTTPILDEQPRFILSNWYGTSVRVGCFDDQNGIFWEYDGKTLWAVRRTSTLQITGLVNAIAGQNAITQSPNSTTRFTQQFKVNDKFTLKGMSYTVVSIPNDALMYCSPNVRGVQDIVNGQICKVKDIRVPQSQFNRDTIDGNGPSGFRFRPEKMQMVGIQYTWYGAGFIDFMMRGPDGNWVYAHRMRQNNINDEAYMRTGNMSVRYEIINEMSHASGKLASAITSTDTSLTLQDQNLSFWPPTGTVMVDNELIQYSNITSNVLTGLTRPSTLSYNIGNLPYTLSAGPASAHLTGNTAFLFSSTCSPSLTHWGSALLMDGNFDNDRGYLFNYQVNAKISALNAGQTRNLFALRLAPHVSNGIVGDFGTRELMNRAQFLLQRLDVWAQAGTTAGTGSCIVSGILNPYFLNNSVVSAANMTAQNLVSFNGLNWLPINNSVGNSALQPSFAQYTTDVANSNYSYIPGTGERIFSTICNAGSQYSIDLTGLKEISCNCVGGNNIFPDGPDILLIQLTAFPDSTLGGITAYSLNLFWGEAQA